MLKTLASAASILDEQGYPNIADHLDKVIKKLAYSDMRSKYTEEFSKNVTDNLDKASELTRSLLDSLNENTDLPFYCRFNSNGKEKFIRNAKGWIEEMSKFSMTMRYVGLALLNLDRQTKMLDEGGKLKEGKSFAEFEAKFSKSLTDIESKFDKLQKNFTDIMDKNEITKSFDLVKSHIVKIQKDFTETMREHILKK